MGKQDVRLMSGLDQLKGLNNCPCTFLIPGCMILQTVLDRWSIAKSAAVVWDDTTSSAAPRLCWEQQEASIPPPPHRSWLQLLTDVSREAEELTHILFASPASHSNIH